MKKGISAIAAITLVAIGVIYGLAGITTIEPGEVGLEISMIGLERGIKPDTLNTGTRWVEPFTNDVVTYDTRDQQYSIYANDADGIPASTKDGQPITVDVSLQIGLIDAKVPNLHETVGPNYFDQVIYPAARSITRANTSKLLSDEIYTGEGRERVQKGIEEALKAKLEPIGIRVAVNLRDIEFNNKQFVKSLEDKADAAQKVIIERRNAEKAEQLAIGVANTAEGAKQKVIKEAEAERERLKLLGEGERLQQEEQAKGILAIAKANAEGTRLQVLAYGSGDTYASVKWAEHMGPNVKVYGFPTGAPGTSSIMDLNGIMKGALNGVPTGSK